MFFKTATRPGKTLCDPLLVSRLQPAGNLKLGDERYIKTGENFCSCIQLYGYPGTATDFWLSSLAGMDGVYTTMDIATQDKEKALEGISRSLDELEDRYHEAKTVGTQIEDEDNYKLLHGTLTALKTQGEVIKLLLCRIYVSGATRTQVDERVHTVIKSLEGTEYLSAVFLNETEFQYRALFSPYGKQAKQRNKPLGTPMPARSLAGGYPFNFQELSDPCGMFLGITDSGGNIFFDLFQKTKMRISFDTLFIGKKGAGKSTGLKMILENNGIIGNYIRILDINGEFTKISETLGGVVISMDGSNGCINYLEVFRVSEDERINFTCHLSKLNTFYKFINPTATIDDCNEFEEFVRRLYMEKGLWDETDPKQITGLAPDCYPTFPELLELIRSDLYENLETRKINTNLSPSRWKRLESIELTLNNLVNSYTSLFCSHTSIPNLADKRIIVYNVQGISNMKREIFDALLFNILNLMLDDMIRIGGPSKKLYEIGTPMEDIPKLLLMIDEAHEFINTRNTQALEFMLRIVQEGRKFFTGLLLASPSIRSFAPESSSEALEKLKILFELCQYKFIMQQDSNALDLMRKIFEQDLTPSQFAMVPKLEQGECFLLTGEEVLHSHLQPTKKELDLFTGGA